MRENAKKCHFYSKMTFRTIFLVVDSKKIWLEFVSIYKRVEYVQNFKIWFIIDLNLSTIFWIAVSAVSLASITFKNFVRYEFTMQGLNVLCVFLVFL